MRRWTAILALALVAGCGGEGGPRNEAPDPYDEPIDAPAPPPAGWRTVADTASGFTVAAPRTWSARRRRAATVLRSDDRLVVISIAADRGRTGRTTSPARYARATLRSLPRFRGRISRAAGPVPGSPYRSAVVRARGRLGGARALQRLTAAVFHRPGRVTYAAIVFRNARVKPRFNDPIVRRVLRSFRARPPYHVP